MCVYNSRIRIPEFERRKLRRFTTPLRVCIYIGFLIFSGTRLFDYTNIYILLMLDIIIIVVIKLN